MTQTRQLHIASFVLHAHPDTVGFSAQALALFPEVDVITADKSGKVVFLVEAACERRIADIVDAMRDVAGVHAVSMVEHHMDAECAMTEEVLT